MELIVWSVFGVFVAAILIGAWWLCGVMAEEQAAFIQLLEDRQRQGHNVLHDLAGSGLLKPEYEAQAQRELLELRIRKLENKPTP